MDHNFSRDPPIISNIVACIFKQFLDRMKQVFSCQLFNLLVLLFILMLFPMNLKSQEGSYTIEIRQPQGDSIFICPGQNIIFIADGQNQDGSAFDPNQVTFTWDFGNLTETLAGNTVSYNYSEGGHYLLSLSATSLNGIPAQNVPQIHVFVAMTPYFTGTRSDNSSFCSGNPITLTGFVTPNPWQGDDSPFENVYEIGEFVWEGPGMVTDRHGVGKAQPPLDEGHMTYIFRVKDNFGCFQDTTLMLYGVYAEYSFDPLTGEAPLEVTFAIDSSSNGGFESSIDYSWEFFERTRDSVDPYTSETELYTFEQPGEYITRMIASYDRCSYSYIAEGVVMVDSSLLEVPNVFTPNEDGANDFFQIKALSLKSFHGQIFNRWGKLVYEWDDWKTPEAGWNGKNMGTGANSPSGTYFYVISATGWDFNYVDNEYKVYKDKIYTGSVSLFR